VSEQNPIEAAQQLPSGAHFLKCALQVNPFGYLRAHGRPSSFNTEHDYNAAILAACRDLDIDVIAVTDHYRVSSAAGLIDCAKNAGIQVFPGFEAVTKDGVHLLCLFDPGTNLDTLERILGDCGIIHHDHKGSPTGKYDTIELLDESQKWGAVCIAAHVASDGGLLRKLSGQPRVNAWRSRNLLACSLPGPVSDAPDDLRPILENKNVDHCRERAVAIVNAKDVSDPEDLKDPGASCWIKMSEVSVEGLRQAFLDPGSRIRLNTDPVPEEHAELVALAWEGGFLDGAAIHFNPNLNVLIGGRGTGKSTVVESLRYVLGLDPIGEEARKAHEGIVRHVLRSGTKISLLARSYRPAKREYRIERTIPNPPVVRDETGQISNLRPQEVLPRVEVYGQHEISELTKSKEKLTRLLDRFVERDESLGRRKADLRRELEKIRRSILDVRAELQQIEDRLAALPGLEETLKRFQEAGLEDRLREQSLLVREERVLDSIPERLQPFHECLEILRGELPIDRVFLSSKALEELPGKDILAGANDVLARLSQDLEQVARQLEGALERAEEGIGAVRVRWNERKREVQAAYEKILRELQKSAVDGEEFIRLRRQIESLRPLRERRTLLQKLEKEQGQRRRELLAEWEDLKAEEFRLLDRAAKKVSRKLRDRVEVQVTAAGDREPLFRVLREEIGGRLSEAIDTLAKAKDFSLPKFVDSCRAGAEAVQKTYGITPAQAERLAKAPPEVLMRIEELELPPTTAIRLNTAPAGEPPSWQALEELSTGQKATAVLLLLLLESDAPLVVDQPEDDLDNRFITEGVVPRMRDEKRRRQFVFSTHNANIPVLGDAELILGLTASGEADGGRARIAPEHMGSIDSRSVRELVEEILEGGKEAFEMRRLKYGF
jgi:predicted ATPase